jgi:hypothetical protein
MAEETQVLEQEQTTTTASPETDLPVEGQQPESSEAGAGTESKQHEQQASAQAQAPAQGDASAAPAWWKPDLFKLRYRGSEVSPKDYQHAVALMQKGYSYEQAMAGVKRDKEALDARGKQFEQYEKLDRAFKENPEFARRIQQFYVETMGGGGQQLEGQVAQPAAIPPQMVRQLQEFQQFKAQAEERMADQDVEREIGDLRSKFADEKWDQQTETGHSFMYDVIAHARDNRFPSLLAAYRDYTYDRLANTAKMRAAEQAAQTRQRQTRQGVVAGQAATRPAAKPPLDVTKMSYDDITANIKRDMGLQ